MHTTWPLLSIIIWLPILGGVVLMALQKILKDDALRIFAFFIVSASLYFCIQVWQGFDASTWAFQFQEKIAWLPGVNINYTLGVDGFALPLVALTILMTLLVIVTSRSIQKQVGLYLSAFMMMQGMMCGVFLAMDAILFYVFFEAMLIPMFLIIGIWGGPNRIYATVKFFLYTFLGSVLLLIALIYLHMLANQQGVAAADSFAIATFHGLSIPLDTQKWLFFAFLIAFAVKVPMWPVHTWLPDAHVEAPTGGSVILAAITLKMGGYGMLRFMLPIANDACAYFAGFVILLSLIAIAYIGFVAIVQQDMKKLIAYSSISHMGFVTMGLFLVFGVMAKDTESQMASMGVDGAMMQMVSHGFISGAMFLCVGVLYDRVHSRLIKDYGGVVNTMPIFASFFMLFAMANAGLPGTSGFVGEFFVILSAFQADVWYAVIAATTLILGATYTLWMYKRVIFGAVQSDAVAALKDLSWTETVTLTALAGMVLAVGIYPAPLVDVMHASSQHLVTQVVQTKLM